MKKCSRCGELKDISFFYKKGTTHDGCSEQCKDCRQEYDRQYYKKNRVLFLERAKGVRERNTKFIRRVRRRSVCERCGEKRWYVLDFHHRDPKDKVRSIPLMCTNQTIDSIKKEIRKCVVLCSNCHREVHYLLGID